jgi:hypothetical protein
MIALEEHQFEILPNELSTTGVGFGIGLDVSVDGDGWDPGESEWQIQDSINQVRGTRNFGRDSLVGPTHTWAAHVDQEDVPTAVAALETLRTAWMAKDIVGIPGRMAIVRYRLADRVRRFYGRPRKWAAPPSNRILSGYVPITMTFDTADALFYDDTADSATIPFAPVSEGGFIFPTTFPAETLPPGQREGAILVGGTIPTYPVIRFNGPVNNPSLQCGSQWKLQLNMNILSGDYVEIDTRPWKLTVLRNGLYSEAGKLSRRTWLKDLVLKPGPQELTFLGSSAEGSSSCTITWRSAYASI